jgi:hypothetical protein
MYDETNYSDNIHDEEAINWNWEYYKERIVNDDWWLLIKDQYPEGIDEHSFYDVVERTLKIFFEPYKDRVHNREEIKNNYEEQKGIAWICSRYHFFMGNEVPEGIDPDSYGDVVFSVLQVFFKNYFNEEGRV